MNPRCIPIERETPPAPEYALEKPEEDEQIARPDALVAQMALGRAFLPEKRSPAKRSRAIGGHQIRIQVGARTAPDTTAGQI